MTKPIGRPAGGRKLTDDQIRELRRRYYTSKTYGIANIVRDFGISQGLASKIVKFRIYNDIT